jgi:hypothetical protein
MVKCDYCGNTRATETETGCKCGKCGIETRNPIWRVDLHKRKPVALWRRLISAVLFKLYYLSVRINKRLEGEVRKPRFGGL